MLLLPIPKVEFLIKANFDSALFKTDFSETIF